MADSKHEALKRKLHASTNSKHDNKSHDAQPISDTDTSTPAPNPDNNTSTQGQPAAVAALIDSSPKGTVNGATPSGTSNVGGDKPKFGSPEWRKLHMKPKAKSDQGARSNDPNAAPPMLEKIPAKR